MTNEAGKGAGALVWKLELEGPPPRKLSLKQEYTVVIEYRLYGAGGMSFKAHKKHQPQEEIDLVSEAYYCSD